MTPLGIISQVSQNRGQPATDTCELISSPNPLATFKSVDQSYGEEEIDEDEQESNALDLDQLFPYPRLMTSQSPQHGGDSPEDGRKKDLAIEKPAVRPGPQSKQTVK